MSVVYGTKFFFLFGHGIMKISSRMIEYRATTLISYNTSLTTISSKNIEITNIKNVICKWNQDY